jgi:hypothetical protein
MLEFVNKKPILSGGSLVSVLDLPVLDLYPFDYGGIPTWPV